MNVLEKNGENNLKLNIKQISSLISALVIVLFITFVAGFYWGKKNNIIELQEEFGQEALTDTIVYGLVLKNQQDNVTLDLK